jgi:ornithine cyclodeaminase/alanine dehydrogenase-like protein (mu-crystallin family)
MKPFVFDDNDVHRLLSYAEAVAVMEEVFTQRARGTTAGLPRWNFSFPQGKLTFTVGSVEGSTGFRVYLRGGFQRDDQLVAVWDTQSGRLQGLIVGERLGVMRTGAIGGVAVKHLARQDTSSLALIGTGRQAMAQLQAILAVRPAIGEVRVFSRNPDHRQRFCDAALGHFPRLNIYPTDTAEATILGADIVIGATTSREPVIRGEWLKPGAHITTMGPKGRREREVDEEVVGWADFLVTDSPDQAAAMETGLITDGTDKMVHDLAVVVSGQVGRPSDQAITLFISTGLAGTEVALGAHLIRKVWEDEANADETLRLG